MDLRGALRLLYLAIVDKSSREVVEYLASMIDLLRATGSLWYVQSHLVSKAKFVAEIGEIPKPLMSREIVTVDHLIEFKLFLWLLEMQIFSKLSLQRKFFQYFSMTLHVCNGVLKTDSC